jgi:uncharacterized membrane protein YkoI
VRILAILAFLTFGAVMPLQQEAHAQTGYMLAQSNGVSLSQAIEQVRRQTGGQILSAETRVQGGREVHHIKVLINNKQVKTYKINGRKR